MSTDTTYRRAVRAVEAGDHSDAAWAARAAACERAGLPVPPDPTEDPVMDKLHASKVSRTAPWADSPRWADRHTPGMTLATIATSLRQNMGNPELHERFWILVPHVGYADHDVLPAANLQAFDELHGHLASGSPWNADGSTADVVTDCDCVVADGGSRWVRLGCLCPGRVELAETLASLESYPVLDDELHSRMETEAFDESWDSWMRADLERDLAKAIGAESVDGLTQAHAFGTLEPLLHLETGSDHCAKIAKGSWINGARVPITAAMLREALDACDGVTIEERESADDE